MFSTLPMWVLSPTPPLGPIRLRKEGCDSTVDGAAHGSELGSGPLSTWNRHRLPNRQRDARDAAWDERALPPEAVRARDRDWQDWDTASKREEGGPIAKWAQDAIRRACPLWIDSKEVPLAEDPLGETERLEVGGAASHPKDTIHP
jgi:hypothetical protein